MKQAAESAMGENPNLLPDRAKRDILGVGVATFSAEQAVAALDERITKRLVTVVAFLNANLSNLAATDADLFDALKRALVLNDGIGLDIASLVLHGEKFPDNLNGTDFIPRFLAETSHRLRIYLLGAKPEIVADALEKFREMTPHHDFVGARNGYFSAAERPEVLRAVRESKPDVVLLAFGNPLQEKFASSHIHEMGCTLVFCVGGLFDFVSERATRAPIWLRRLRSEWLYRFYKDPGRLWRRYLFGNPQFLLRVGFAKVRSFLRGSGDANSPESKTQQQHDRANRK